METHYPAMDKAKEERNEVAVEIATFEKGKVVKTEVIRKVEQVKIPETKGNTMLGRFVKPN
jgi:hypothetical protein